MRKYLIYIGVLVVGVFLGWLVFGGGEKTSSNDAVHDHKEAEGQNEIWTCSMHPQIRQNEPGACPICGMDLIPLEENTSNNPYVLEMSEEAVKISQIQTTKVSSEGQGSSNLEISGKIEVNESNSASLVTHIPGRIEKLYVSFTGEKVSKGQKIAAIYSPLLITAQKELLEAQKIKGNQPQLFEAAKNKLKYWKITDKQIEEILSSQEVIETFNIYAAYSGVVKRKQVSVGDYLTEGKVLFDVQNLNNLWVVFDVYERDIQQVKVGDVITFSTTSNPGMNLKLHS
jgi:Cu(I)/Ag(I) efflux system membrane fusion protein